MQMKTVLIFGAGKSATCLIDYLIAQAPANNWHILVADQNMEQAAGKVGNVSQATALAVNITDAAERSRLIARADIVVSMLPPHLHLLVAESCLSEGTHLLTASYADEKIRGLAEDVKKKGLLFLCEMGLDPGIDHMSAMQLVHRIQSQGGNIRSFHSHCGGLVAPESDNNPWHYKISWNPRNVVMAGKSGAVYKQSGAIITTPYEKLFLNNPNVSIPGYGSYAWYPNRDSLAYANLYALNSTATFIRTTLRHPDFCKGWSRIVALGLTDDTLLLDTDTLTYAELTRRQYLKQRIAPKETALQKNMLSFLGLYEEQVIGRGQQTAAEILQHLLETKLTLREDDRDMIIMLHELAYQQDAKPLKISSCLIVKGDNHLRTAMAKTVGLPLGIAAALILQNKIRLTGLHLPTLPEIYAPVLKALEREGIRFTEETQQ